MSVAGWQVVLAVNGAFAIVAMPLFYLFSPSASADLNRLSTPERAVWTKQIIDGYAGSALVASIAYFGLRYGQTDLVVRRFCLVAPAVYFSVLAGSNAVRDHMLGDTNGVVKSIAWSLSFPVIAAGALIED
jgi:hypothetical protein